MNAEQWSRVKELFHGALEREPPQRMLFVRAGCGDDTVVRAEVERLLAAHAQSDAFIERPVMNGLSGRIGHYEVGRMLGAGGMGQVYAARDTELGRDVALKVATGTDAEAHGRLRREAQHASQLNHPHICTIYEVGTHDSRPFIAMEYVEGRPLSDLIPSGGLPVDALVHYGDQIADALAYAHRGGVIHRDLKTDNVVVNPDGRAKILDFGLARRLSNQQLNKVSQSQIAIGAEGEIAGTLPCIAPEVLRGQPADERSDIWAFGILLYEAATGSRPFTGATGFELCGAILHGTLPPLPDRVPAKLRSIVQRCLAKNPSDRFQTVQDIRLALEQLRTPSSRAPFFGTLQMVAVVVLAVGLGAWAIWHRGVEASPSARVAVGASGQPAIAVMSFEVTGASDSDSAWLSKGVPRMLFTGLAQTRGLEVVSTRRLLETAKQIRAGDLDTLDREQAADVARRAGAGAMVVGTIVRSGTELRIDAQLEDLTSGRVLAAESARGTDVFSIVDQLAREIRSGVGLEDATGVRNVADVSTPSLGAYRLFAQGVDAFEHMRVADARRLLTEATRIDPEFAGAYLYLGFVSYFDGRMSERVEYLAQAKKNVHRLNERERLLLEINVAQRARNVSQAERAFDQLISQFPDTEDAYVSFAEMYAPLRGLLHDPQKRLALLKRGVEVLPTSGMLRNAYAYALLENGAIEQGISELETYVRNSPYEPNAYDSLGEAHIAGLMPEKAVEYYSRTDTIDPEFVSGSGYAFALAMLGRFDEAAAKRADSHLVTAVILSRAGRYRDAEKLLASGPKEPAARADALGRASPHLISSILAIERRQFLRAHSDAETAENILREAPGGELRTYLALTDLLAGTVDAREGRLADARKSLESLAKLYNPVDPFEKQWHGALAGEIALASGDLAAAAAAFTASEPDKRYWAPMHLSYPHIISNSPPWRDGMARVVKARGDVAGAIERFRALNAISPSRKWASLFEPRYVLETARLLEKTGDTAGARAEYERFLEYWKKADGDLPELAEARRAVARLRSVR